LSTEERLYKQLDGIVSSIIKALESLEKELSDYIVVTNKRLKILEEKVTKFESLADVSEKGLVKAIESTSSSEKVKTLSHIAPQEHPPAPKVDQRPIPTPPIAKVEAPIESAPIKQPETSYIQPTTTPSIPKPPAFKAELSTEIEAPTVPEIPITETPNLKEPSVEKKDSKKEDEDKDELMSALKIIDSL